jgi:hypothetical protein
MKSSSDGVVVGTDIETGDTFSVEKLPCGIELLHRYIPCIYAKTTLSLTESTDNRKIAPCKTKFESIIDMSKSESFQEDSRPPPLILPATSSETDNEEICRNISENRSQTDPFAPREGKTLCWRNVSMTLVSLVKQI